jgi:hypothetical protein
LANTQAHEHLVQRTITMAIIRSFAAMLVLLFAVCAAAQPVGPPPPKALADQVARLVELLRDRHASGYPPATKFAFLKGSDIPEYAVVAFAVQGYGGGNNHAQYLAMFAVDRETANPFYTLEDVITFGGKGSRAIATMNPRLLPKRKPGEVVFEVDTLEVGPNDPPNFPGKKGVARLRLKDNRLSEIR